MVNIDEEIKHHELLFSGSSLIIGKVHWYILKASKQLGKLSTTYYKIKIGNREIEQPKNTEFGEDIEYDPIHWWIFKKETNVQKLKERTQKTLEAVQKLKEESNKLKDQFYVKSYKELIENIKKFTEDNKDKIDKLYDFVIWLNNRDKLAPIILLTYRVWGSTRISDRWIDINNDNVNQDLNILKLCTIIALGLGHSIFRYTINEIHIDLGSKIADSIDLSDYYEGPIHVPKDELYIHTARKVLDEIATYFEFLRQSLRNILIDIDKFNIQSNLIYQESFWKKFIMKAMSEDRIENELWDFKETFEMWHNKEEKFKIKFCELIAAFANQKGGVLIVGITDKFPRKIAGIEDLENKIKTCKSTIHKYIKYDKNFVECVQVLFSNEIENKKNCLVIVTAQTKQAVAVIDESNKYSYPIRLGTGLERTDKDKIENSKRFINHDNYDYISDLQNFMK